MLDKEEVGRVKTAWIVAVSGIAVLALSLMAMGVALSVPEIGLTDLSATGLPRATPMTAPASTGSQLVVVG